ncbi:longitudinals lacking protein, isoforms H/M/V-like isoform X2 [Hyposmocoma kahamanoa]|uniref:longitudinals lacking protein, isoforms H/M/V-like isoform X2 n=1 Tax=Hyposmocoma kahamanoa TaxID=1477025 RepID=UPI000E6D9DDE|nr:longitudinals lacking protein, isoforms H/M/V-like isoform X2 [Hyposmocoma kahamanoa]
MAMCQQYSLRWNNHQPNFISMFTTLLNTQTLVDVTLAAEGRHLQAHKVVLCACSTYFQSLFMDNPSQHPIVILKDVTFADLRTMVDFMYYGEVNVTEEQLTQVLDTAKLLKIKGLTEMPDSTSLRRSQGTSADFQQPGDAPGDSQRHSASPTSSPTMKRKRRRKSSSGSTQLNTPLEEGRGEDQSQAVEMVRGDAITLSSVPQQRRVRDFNDERERMDANAQQSTEQQNLGMDTNPEGIPQESSSSYSSGTAGLKLRRAKYFKRQSRVQPDDREMRKQVSEPGPPPSTAPPLLQKHESYPQYTPKKGRVRQESEVGSLQIRAVPSSLSSTMSLELLPGTPPPPAPRASHTPAVRLGPPLSCNFCWNTVDDSGRILRRKTQYHCPECRTNLCIVPCFHQYHEGSEADATASAR